ncbi:diguanylate cyclase, partial [Arthrospira platensis SPKY1]|nr:diguanylate cyclase [Arthrospira platensis SPKY1]
SQHPSGTSSAVLHIDLERYRRVNNSLGHESGDALLYQLAQRLAHALADSAAPPRQQARKPQSTLARWSGAEFVVLVTDLASATEARRVAQRLLDNIRQPFRSGKDEIVLNARIGIAVFPSDGATASALINASVAATQHAKGSGTSGPQFYSPTIDADARLRLQLESDLRHALADGAADGELLLHYQPKCDHDGKVRGAEALVRWQHPTLGLLPPQRFIPLAEECGLIIALGEWVAHRVCAQMHTWRDAGLPPVPVAIN